MSKYKVCGYDMEILHLRMLEITCELDRICRENNIRYSLYGGSVIGAVRHNGFIPWDHDMDIAMIRKDYENFRKYCRKHLSDKFFFSNYKSEPLYPYNFGKMRLNSTVFVEGELQHLNIRHGVFIDVHPIDNIIPCFLKAQVRISSFLRCIHNYKCGVYKGLKWKKVVYGIFSILPYSMLNLLRDFSMRMFNCFPTKYVYKIAHPNNGVYPIPRSTFKDLVEHRFEDKVFFIPRSYDEFLRKRYGDYMKLPPESEIYDCCGSIVKCQL